MVEYTLQSRGYLVALPKGFNRELLVCRSSYFDPFDGRSYPTSAHVYFYPSRSSSKVVGIGAIRHLSRIYPQIRFTIKVDHNLVDLSVLDIVDLPNLQLRQYQSDCLKAMIRAPGGIVRLPTGSGKGEIIVSYAWSALHSYARDWGHVLLLSKDQSALRNIMMRLEQYSVPYVTYSHTRSAPPQSSSIIVSTPMLLVNDYRNKNNELVRSQIRTIIVDECHHLSARTWQELYLGLPSLSRSFGLSATVPNIRPDDPFFSMDIHDAIMLSLTGEVIYSRLTSDPEVATYLDVPLTYEVEYHWPDPLTTNSWSEISEKIENNDLRHEYIAKIADTFVDFGFSVLSITSRRSSASKQFLRCKSSAILWFGGGAVRSKDQSLNVDQVFRDFGRGVYKAIFATPHLNEAVDLPALDVVILSENRKDLVTIQRAGRSTRKGGRKSIVINVVDVNGGVLEHHSRMRSRSLQREYGDSPVRIKSLTELSNLAKRISSLKDCSYENFDHRK